MQQSTSELLSKDLHYETVTYHFLKKRWMLSVTRKKWTNQSAFDAMTLFRDPLDHDNAVVWSIIRKTYGKIQKIKFYRMQTPRLSWHLYIQKPYNETFVLFCRTYFELNEK